MTFCALESESTDVENLDVLRDIERRISEIEKDLEVSFSSLSQYGMTYSVHSYRKSYVWEQREAVVLCQSNHSES